MADNASTRAGTADPHDLRQMAEAWAEDIFPTPPEELRAKDAAAADVLRRATVPHLLACADEIERLRDGIRRHREVYERHNLGEDDDHVLWALLDDRTETT